MESQLCFKTHFPINFGHKNVKSVFTKEKKIKCARKEVWATKLTLVIRKKGVYLSRKLKVRNINHPRFDGFVLVRNIRQTKCIKWLDSWLHLVERHFKQKLLQICNLQNQIHWTRNYLDSAKRNGLC